MTADQDQILNDIALNLKNDSKWYLAAKLFIRDNDWCNFRDASISFIEQATRHLSRDAVPELVTRILINLWRERDGGRTNKFYVDAKKLIATRDKHRKQFNDKRTPVPGSVWDTSFTREDSSYAGVLYRVAKPKESTMAVGLASACIESLSSNYPQPKEPPMNAAIPIETITYVYGQDVKGMTEAQLIAAIKQVEKEIGLLSDVKSKSKKIAAKIAEYEKTLADIVAVLDAK